MSHAAVDTLSARGIGSRRGLGRHHPGQLEPAPAAAGRTGEQRRRAAGPRQGQRAAATLDLRYGASRLCRADRRRRRASASTRGGDRLRAGGRRRIAVGLARGGDRPRQRRRRGIPRAARRSAACVRARGRPDRRPQRLETARRASLRRAHAEQPHTRRARERDHRSHHEDRDRDRRLDPRSTRRARPTYSSPRRSPRPDRPARFTPETGRVPEGRCVRC